MKTYKDYLHDFLLYRLGKSNGYRTQAFYLATQIDFQVKTGASIETEVTPVLTAAFAKNYASPWFDTVPTT